VRDVVEYGESGFLVNAHFTALGAIARIPEVINIQEQHEWIERLQAALKQFADWSGQLDGNYTTRGYPDACPIALCPDKPNKGAPTVGDLRRARIALEQSVTQRESS